MEKYVYSALQKLKNSDKLKVEITLKSANDYKPSVLKTGYNKLIFAVQKKIIPCHFKNFLMRTTGMHIGHDVCIPGDITFDPYFPELITIENGCIVGGLSTLITHEVKGKKLTLGKILIKERTLSGGVSTLMPGSVINKNSILMFFSELRSQIPAGELWGGKPAKHLSKLTTEEIDKYFKPSNHRKDYYKDFRQKVNAFRKDPKQMYFKMHYDGKRLNAGDDWWRAQNVLNIWWRGAFVEISTIMSACFLKNSLLRLGGVKIGRNVSIGRGSVIDHLYGNLAVLEDNVRIGKRCFIDTHSYTISQSIFGKVHIKKGAVVEDNCFISCGTTIGENSVIKPGSMAQREILANEIWQGMPAKKIGDVK